PPTKQLDSGPADIANFQVPFPGELILDLWAELETIRRPEVRIHHRQSNRRKVGEIEARTRRHRVKRKWSRLRILDCAGIRLGIICNRVLVVRQTEGKHPQELQGQLGDRHVIKDSETAPDGEFSIAEDVPREPHSRRKIVQVFAVGRAWY